MGSKHNSDRAKKNHAIRAKKVRLIDEKDENHGVVPIEIAMGKAKDVGLDLVEVSAAANPPVVKIMEYGKYLYEQEKKTKLAQKNSQSKQMKEFKFRPVTDDHDINNKVGRAVEYLNKGHNVRLSMFRRGREPQELAEETFDKILTHFEEYSSIEPKVRQEGRRRFITFKGK